MTKDIKNVYPNVWICDESSKDYDNIWLGSNELAIVSCDGNYCVRERDLDYKTVFRGSYKKCFEYCENRYLEYENEWFKYMESIAD